MADKPAKKSPGRRVPCGPAHWESSIVACPAGHRYDDPANVLHYRGRRLCRACRKARDAKDWKPTGRRPGPRRDRAPVQFADPSTEPKTGT